MFTLIHPFTILIKYKESLIESLTRIITIIIKETFDENKNLRHTYLYDSLFALSTSCIHMSSG